MQDVDVKDEVSDADSDSYSNTSTSYRSTRLSSCSGNINILLDVMRHMQPVVALEKIDVPR